METSGCQEMEMDSRSCFETAMKFSSNSLIENWLYMSSSTDGSKSLQATPESVSPLTRSTWGFPFKNRCEFHDLKMQKHGQLFGTVDFACGQLQHFLSCHLFNTDQKKEYYPNK